MDSQVRAIPDELLAKKFEGDHEKGRSRDDHGFNWHAASIKHYEAVWDRCEGTKAGRAQL
jgi:hypothetical protein